MAKFGLVKSFNIDKGELNGLRRKDCFVLGYELAQIDGLLKNPKPIDMVVHSENQERIIKSCVDAKRMFTLTWMSADISEGWMRLVVAAKGYARHRDSIS